MSCIGIIISFSVRVVHNSIMFTQPTLCTLHKVFPPEKCCMKGEKGGLIKRSSGKYIDLLTMYADLISMSIGSDIIYTD